MGAVATGSDREAENTEYRSHVRVSPTDSTAATSSDDVAKWLKRLKASSMYEQANRAAYTEDIAFYSGDTDDAGQWEQGTRQKRQNAGRPTLTINVLPMFVEQIMGDIRLNQPRIKVHPQGNRATPELAAVYDGIIKSIEYNSNAEKIYDDAANQMVVGGIGAWRLDTEFIPGSFDQHIIIRPITDPMTVYWQPRPFDADNFDADWCMITYYMTKEDFEKEYGDKVPLASIQETGKGDMNDWFDKDRIKLAECYERVRSTRTICQMSDGSVLSLEDAETKIEEQEVLLKLQQANQEETVSIQGILGQPSQPLQEPTPQLRIVKKRDEDHYHVYHSVICGTDVLEKPVKTVWENIPVVQLWGKQLVVQGKRFVRGMIRNAKDAQRTFNYMRSSEVEMAALQPRVPWVATQKMIEGYEADWNSANVEAKSVLRYKTDPDRPNDKPQRTDPVQTHPGFFQGSNSAMGDMKMTMGIFNDSLGIPTGMNRSGIAIKANIKESDVGNYTYFANFIRGLEWTGKLIVQAIPKVYDTERIIQTRDQASRPMSIPVNMPRINQQTGLPDILNDLSIGRFGVAIDTGPSFTTQREEAVENIMRLLPTLQPQQVNIITDLIFRYQDWPGAQEFADRLEKLVPPQITGKPQQQPLPPNPAQIAAQAKAQQEQLRAQTLKLKTQQEMVKLLSDTVKLKREQTKGTEKELIYGVLEEIFNALPKEEAALSAAPAAQQSVASPQAGTANLATPTA